MGPTASPAWSGWSGWSGWSAWSAWSAWSGWSGWSLRSAWSAAFWLTGGRFSLGVLSVTRHEEQAAMEVSPWWKKSTRRSTPFQSYPLFCLCDLQVQLFLLCLLSGDCPKRS